MSGARQMVQIGFAGTAALLAALLVYEVAAPLPEFDPPAFRLKPRAPRIANVAAVAAPTPDAFIDIALRPPFDPSRKSVVASAASDASAAPPEVTLVGVIVDGANSLALLKTAASPLATAYRVGATISGWQVTEISPDRVVLGAGPARSEIRLQANKSAPAASQPPAPLNSQ
ncbi:MAG TPA: hypothetical protein VG889_13000 [Rhizomicrobium sp.]|nr:hypothetical protein [Rhizomicrobium sp.]